MKRYVLLNAISMRLGTLKVEIADVESADIYNMDALFFLSCESNKNPNVVILTCLHGTHSFCR